MKVPVCLALFLSAAPAIAQPPPQKPVCIRAGDNNDYNARPIGLHEVLARNQMGSDRRGVRLTTTCTHIDRTATIALRATTYCIRQGDTVTVSVPLGRRETCRVTAVSQVPEDYAKAEYKYR